MSIFVLWSNGILSDCLTFSCYCVFLFVENEKYEISVPTADDVKGLAEIQIQYWIQVWNGKVDDKQKAQKEQAFQAMIEEMKKDERQINLVMKDAAGNLVGFCGGGPLRQPQIASPETAPDAELYGICFNPAVIRTHQIIPVSPSMTSIVCLTGFFYFCVLCLALSSFPVLIFMLVN